MDSMKIAERLEKDYPTPSLHLDSPLVEEVNKVLNNIMMPLRGIAIPGVYTNVVSEPSKEYFGRTRGERVGKPLHQFAKENGGEEAWMEALPGIKALGVLLKENGGPFVTGDTREWWPLFFNFPDIWLASYADFIIVGYLQFLKVIEEDVYQRLTSIDPAIGKLYDASKLWLERNDH